MIKALVDFIKIFFHDGEISDIYRNDILNI